MHSAGDLVMCLSDFPLVSLLTDLMKFMEGMV